MGLIKEREGLNESVIRQEIKDYKGKQKEIKPHLEEHCKGLWKETISTAGIGLIIRELKYLNVQYVVIVAKLLYNLIRY
ncbi:MAG: hypothetical protein LBS29_00520 [Endomicrobium sp.]|uniref:hypothetical protein n=1 Tax=Candidatus Endomicrobiellum cubanum TaxID=3242325 RepID=UPI00281F088E|nr:hypothetical protein [Endomicrobium sp.]MDR2396145.1 hypothetical protein [Endomicrobium sp.]